MGRYGVGHGALAIRRDRRRRVRRSSVGGDRSYHHSYRPENYLFFYNQHEQRKSSLISSQSAPVKGSGDAGAAATAEADGQLPGQMPVSPRPVRSEGGETAQPGPSWWPGPPLRQGGVVVPDQQDQSLLSDVMGVLTGRANWQSHSRLWPKLGEVRRKGQDSKGDAATKTSQHMTKADELPNGKSAWAGKVGDKRPARRWPPKNKEEDQEEDSEDGDDIDEVQVDAGGDSLEKRADGKYRQTGVVNIVLYVGLGLIALGLIITFVGMGEHGFKTKELRLIGPSLIGCGFLFCLLRLFFCSAPACCRLCGRKNKPLDEKSLLSPSRETLAEDTTTTTTETQPQPHSQERAREEAQEEGEEEEVPQRLDTHEEDDEQETRRMTAKSVRRVQSTIPNFIEDECEDDADLGLHVEYMDEVSEVVTPRQRIGGSVSSSRPSSTHSRLSSTSKIPRLPDIHTNGQPEREIVLNPATLEGGVD